jgi:4-diphosphocytidyl-2-C-methyl-D-erythritol kinase
MLHFEELYPDIYLLKVPFSGLWTGVMLIKGEENCLIDSGAKDTDVDQHILPALAELGGQIGSDIPFCVLCGTAMAEGRGEKLRPLPNVPDCIFVVCKPDFSVSTPALYAKIDEKAIAQRPDHRAMESALLAGDLGAVAQNLCNVFDPIVTEEHLELNYIKSIFNSYGAVGYQMTGSGSAVYCIVENFEYAAVICSMLRENYPQVFIAKPI